MKRMWGMLCCCLSSFIAFAQGDPVVMRINGLNVLRSEFEDSYALHRSMSEHRLTPKEYVPFFVQEWMKVVAAKEAGLDTTLSYRIQHEAVRRQLVKTSLVDTAWMDSCLHSRYSKTTRRNVRVQVMQVFRSLPQNMSVRRLEEAKQQMTSLYQSIQKRSDVDFKQWVDRYSDDKEVRWLFPLQATAEFEQHVFSLPVDGVSVLFYTPAGLHIVKVVARKELSVDSLVVNERNRWLAGNRLPNQIAIPLVERLKQERGFVPHSSGLKELLYKGETSQTLFTIGGKPYDGTLFKQFASSHPQALERQLLDFISKSVLDEASDSIEVWNESAKRRLHQADVAYLVQEITRMKVDGPAAADRAGWAAYFEVHRSHYRWEIPRYKGAVIHCADKKTAKRVKKILKKLPFDNWKERVAQEVASASVGKVKMEQGTWEIGQNSFVDKLVFKQGEFQPLVSYPFTIVVGNKQKEPEDYREVADRVKKDYRAFLYACWMKELKAAGSVDVISDVLKTVNNN